MIHSMSPDDPNSGSSYYGTTLWTLISEARAGSEEAWKSLLERYRGPVRAQIEKRFKDDPENLTWEFLHTTFVQKLVPAANRDKGRFRALLSYALQNFISSKLRERYADKRRGSATDGTVANNRSIDEPDHPEYADDKIDLATLYRDLDRAVALTTANIAWESVRTSYLKRKGGSTEACMAFEMLVGREAELPLAEIAGKMGTTDGAVKVARHRLRKEFLAAFCRMVADMVPAAEVEEEARYLLGLLA